MAHVKSYFKGDGHNWWFNETEEISVEEAEVWIQNKVKKLQGWGQEVEVINNRMIHRHSRRKFNNSIDNTYVFEVII